MVDMDNGNRRINIDNVIFPYAFVRTILTLSSESTKIIKDNM